MQPTNFNRCLVTLLESTEVTDRTSSHSYVIEFRLKIVEIDLVDCVTNKVKYTDTVPAGLLACVIYQTHAY